MPPEREPTREQPEDAAEATGFTAALTRRETPIAGLTNGRGRPAADRFRVYRNNVIHSLSEALAATFPATRRLMGERFFRAAAVAFAEENKPTSPVLFRYGEGFADFIAALPGLAAHPFVPEAARIEYARVQVFHAADANALQGDALAHLPAEALPALVLEPHPAVRLIRAPSGGVSAWQQNQDPALPPVEAAAALITRPGVEVLVTPLSAPAAAFAAALLDGRPLGEAAAVDDLDLAPALAALLGAGAFRSLRVAETS